LTKIYTGNIAQVFPVFFMGNNTANTESEEIS